MLIIGLTGGIGSGKSVASDKFKSLGITIVDADVASRTVVEPGKPALKEIEDHFGSGIITAEGKLDRNNLREIIATDPEERKWLESVTHPKIGEQITKEISESTSVYTLFVAPLLLETNSQEMCSRVVVVDVPKDVQIRRTAKRDKVSPNQVEQMVAAQMEREKRLEKADDVLLNSGTIEDLEKQVEELHKKYIQMVE
ncbi:MAG: dephospho-CoA kinase [SAR86 cluster bacterium]|jgi:dephospho-CoA kinase|tara:strand:+ start:1103 stop:1696 length:594 start_codon:yes stop_codon:yes gene_type:complete